MSFLNLEGAYENELTTSGEFNAQAPRTALMLPTGQRIVLSTATLLEALNGVEPVSAKQPGPASLSPEPAALPESGESVIPLIAEQLRVGTREVETARVKVRRETQEHLEKVSMDLTDVHWEVEHHPVERRLETAPEVRQEGEVIIFPLVEERMVVTKELWLREEVHVRRVKTTHEQNAEVPLKRDVLLEERTGV